MNGDGLIDVTDLTNAFLSMGKRVKHEEITEWVAQRDSTGRGAVSFDDFAAHFK
jgi:Ca2+-binding EF-hand superfamily protein